MGHVLVDLDGTLAFWDNGSGDKYTQEQWDNGDVPIGGPIKPMIELIQDHLEDGDEVKIFTARVADGDIPKKVAMIQDWTEKHLGQRLPVTNAKDFQAEIIYDDRAIEIVRNKGYTRSEVLTKTILSRLMAAIPEVFHEF